jgi:hypothetical protein
MTSMSSSTRQGELQAALGQSLSAIFDALINHFMQEGLNALADTVNPEPPADNWSYDGQTLDGGSGGGGGGGAGALNIPQNVSIELGDPTKNPTSTEISGGTPPYSIKATTPITPNTSIATVSITGDETSGYTLTIAGISPGQTSVTIKDSSPNVKRVKVNITVVGNGDLMVIPASINATAGDAVTARISGGTTPYQMSTGPDESIAIAILSGTNIVVSGITTGQTSLVVTDSSSLAKTATVNITIGATTGALGTCLVSGIVITDMSESDCTASGGTWTANDPSSPGPTVTLTADRPTINKGQNVTLTWTSTDTKSCSAYWTEKTTTSGSKTKSPDFTTTFPIICYGTNGIPVSGSMTVEVLNP